MRFLCDLLPEMRCLLIVPRFQEPQNLKNSRYRSRTDFSRSWVLRGSVPLIRSAVWRNRTSKSFPTDWLATSSNTIMGIRHTGWMNRHSITPLTQKNTSHIQSKQGELNHSSSNTLEEIGGVRLELYKPEGTDLQSACFSNCISTNNRRLTVSNNIYRAMQCTMRLFKVHIVLPPIYTQLFYSSSSSWRF